MPIYLRLENIPGDITHKKFRYCIGIHSLQFNIKRAHINAANQDSHLPLPALFSGIHISKDFDKASHQLFTHMCKAIILPKAEFYLTKTISNNEVYAKHILTDVLLTEIDNHAHTDGHATEHLQLNYKTLTSHFYQTNQVYRSGYDLTTNETL